MPLPGIGLAFPALENLAAPATSQSGAIDSRATQGGGVNAPVNIGGFKSDGTPAGVMLPRWLCVVLIAGALVGAWWLYRRST